ncbi:MAG TPA: hypothetical protein DDW52_01525 [Planctomycetaceae bacterium]|nr:hypothetical protein [Planctomycetaceae bacterium]
MCRAYDPQHSIVIQRGEGSRVWDADGREYIDLTCGYSVTNLGHQPPEIVRAAAEQLHQLAHLTGRISPSQIELAETLLELTRQPNHSEERRVIFNTTGSRGIETAIAAAQAARPGRVVSVSPSFHGKSLGTRVHSSIVSQSTTDPSDMCATPAIRRPSHEYPYCGRCTLQTTYPGCEIACGHSLLNFINQNAAEISALLIEPILGARGYIEPPPTYFQQLSTLARQHGITTIADEVQSGLGRCGAWTCSQEQGWTPDLLVFGKSLGAGIVPISAVVGSSEVLSKLSSQQVSETFAGSPFACSIGLATLEFLKNKDVIASGAHVGQQLRSVAGQLFRGIEPTKAPRIEGRGCVCALEFAYEHPAPNAEKLAREFTQACTAAGLLVHWSGPGERTRVVLLPPLNLNELDFKETASRLRQATSIWLQKLNAQES